MSLVKIQSELKAPKNQFNGFGKYKYRSAEDILEALKPLLFKYDCRLTISDEVVETDVCLYVRAKVSFYHNEEMITSVGCAGIDIAKKGMDISQCFGTSSSYARKYALNGMFLIDDTKDADSDEHKNQIIKGEKEASKNATPEMTDTLMSKLVDRFNNGEVNVFDLASKHYVLRSKDVQVIESLKS